MINTSEISRVYMCLDTLKDTRLATLGVMNDDYAFTALLNDFPIRWTDDPATYGDMCDRDEYFKKYEERDIETLKQAYPTEFALDFCNIISDLEVRSISNDPTVSRKLEIVINYWPYKFTNIQIGEFVKAFRAMFKCVTPIRMISRPLKDVTTDWLKEMDIVAAYIYNATYWIDEAITRRFMEGKGVAMAPDIVVYLPSILRGLEESKVLDECLEATGALPDIFATTKLELSRLILIEWVNSIYYSISPTILFPDVEPKEPPKKESDDDSPPPVDKAFLNGGP